MDQSYSVWADMLSKFHNSPDWIQALWLVVVPAPILGVTWRVTHLAKEVAIAALRLRDRRRSILIYGVHQAPKGRWLIYRDGGEAKEIG